MGRYLRSIDHFGEIISRLCLTAVAAYCDNGHPDSRVNHSLQKLAQPSLGDWNNLLNQVLKWYRRNRARTSIQIKHGELFQIIQRLTGTRIEHPDFLANSRLLFRDLMGSEVEVFGLPFRSLADATIRLRNRVSHGGVPSETWLDRTAQAVNESLNLWERLLPFPEEYLLESGSETFETDAGPVHTVDFTKNGEKLFDFGCLLVEQDGLFYQLNGNDRKQKVRYLNFAGSRVLDDTSVLLKKQIVFFSKLAGMPLSEEQLGSQYATSLPELSRILREYKYKPEDILGGDYQLLDEIGRGGMSIVFSALQISRDRLCAVKLLPKGIVKQDAIFQRFQREAQTLETLDHRNIVEFVEFGENEKNAYLVMEYIDGVSLEEIFTRLRSIIDRRPNEADLLAILGTGETEPAGFAPEHRQRAYYYKIVEWIGQAANALEHIHDLGIFHRDLKHANIMIDRVSGRAVLLDFGLAKNQEQTLTIEGQFLGTLRFSSPEQLRAVGHTYDERSDVYSLGIILYELLALRTSFFGESFEQLSQQIFTTEPIRLRQVNPLLPHDLETVAHKCIEKHPGRRYASAGELFEDLKHWRESRPIKARPPTLFERATKWATRNPVRTVAMATMAGAGLMILGIVSFFFLRLLDENVATRKAVVEARSENAQALFAIGREFDAAVAALQAGRVARQLGQRLSAAERQNSISALYRVHYQRRQAAWFQDRFNSVLDVGFSPDGEYLAVANEEFKTINVFRLADGAEIQTLGEHAGPVNALAFASNEVLVAVGGGGAIRFWRFRTGEMIRQLNGHSGAVLEVALEPGSGRLATGGEAGEILLWKPDQDRPDRRFQAHRGAVSGLLFADKNTLISAGSDGAVRTWTLDGRPLDRHATTSPVRAIALDKTGTLLASAHEDGTMRLWDRTTGRWTSHPIETDAELTDLAFSPDGEHLIISSGGHHVLLWRLADDSIQQRWKGHIDLVHTVAFDPRGRFAVSADETGGVRMWRYRERDMVRDTFEHTNATYKAEFSPDGRHFASSGDDGLVKIWKTGERGAGRVLGRVAGHKIMDFDFSADSRRLVAGTWNVTGPPHLRVWDVASGKLLHDFKGHRGLVYSLDYNKKRDLVAAGDFISAEPQLKLWNPMTGRETRSLSGHGNSIVALRFTPDGTGLVSSALDKKIRKWDVATGEQQFALDVPISMASLAVAPDNRSFIGGGYDGSMEIRALADGKLLQRLQAHPRVLVDMAFSPTGRYLLTAGFDRTLKVWRLGSGEPGAEPQLMITLHLEDNPWSVAYLPGDDNRILSSDSAGRIQHWELNHDLDDLLERVCSRPVRNFLKNNPNLSGEERALCD